MTAMTEADPRLVYCACGCGEPLNEKMLYMLDLADSGMKHRQIAPLVDMTPESVKSTVGRARRGEWTKYKKGHTNGPYNPDRRPCPWPGCDGTIPAASDVKHCQRMMCAFARGRYQAAMRNWRRDQWQKTGKMPAHTDRAGPDGPQPEDYPAPASDYREPVIKANRQHKQAIANVVDIRRAERLADRAHYEMWTVWRRHERAQDQMFARDRAARIEAQRRAYWTERKARAAALAAARKIVREEREVRRWLRDITRQEQRAGVEQRRSEREAARADRRERMERAARMAHRAVLYEAKREERLAEAVIELPEETKTLAEEQAKDAKRNILGNRGVLSMDAAPVWRDSALNLYDQIGVVQDLTEVEEEVGLAVGSSQWWAIAKLAPIVPADAASRVENAELDLHIEEDGEVWFGQPKTHDGPRFLSDVPDAPMPTGLVTSPGKMRGRGKAKSHVRRRAAKAGGIAGGRRPKQKSKADK